MYITISNRKQVICPFCRTPLTKKYSRYIKQFQDLSMKGNKVKTRARNLIKLAFLTIKHGNMQIQIIFQSSILDIILNNKYIENFGYKSMFKRYQLLMN
ncbi:hypothetical protein [Clostridium botulinum]|uniref:hypothetical protein n=1 Tax=Clostridium botulinum TaxID=1491 RepID=UPI00069D3E49|nr:hypothetical protein [Clostridium botulinum]